MTDPTVRFVRFRWPATLVGGLLLVAFALVPWGASNQGVRPSITGLGRVSVPGARAEDVAFVEVHTQRPGLVTLLLGTVVFVAAAVAWWRAQLSRWAGAVVAVAAVCAVVWTAVVLGDVAGHLFDDRVTEALGNDLPVMSPGYGLVGSVVVGVVLVGMFVAVVLIGAQLTRSDESS